MRLCVSQEQRVGIPFLGVWNANTVGRDAFGRHDQLVDAVHTPATNLEVDVVPGIFGGLLAHFRELAVFGLPAINR